MKKMLGGDARWWRVRERDSRGGCNRGMRIAACSGLRKGKNGENEEGEVVVL